MPIKVIKAKTKNKAKSKLQQQSNINQTSIFKHDCDLDSFNTTYQHELFKSNDEFYLYVDNEIKKEFQARLIYNNGKMPKFTTGEVTTLLFKIFKIRLLKTNTKDESIFTPYCIDYDHGNGLLYKIFNTDEWIDHLYSYKDFVANTTIDNLKRTVKSQIRTLKVVIYKKNNPYIDIDYLNLPPKHLVLLNNAIIDLNEHIIYQDSSKFNQYHFIHKTPITYIPRRNLSKNGKFYDTVFKKIMNDWSSNDVENLNFLYQLLTASFDGNGRKSYVFLEGSGGNGKSTFLNMCQYLAGDNYTVRLNINQLDDDGSLKSLDERIKLIVGHDAPTDAKLSKKILGRFKQLTTGEGFQIPVKYQDNQICVCFGLKIQNTNTEISIFENSDAMERRLISFQWTNENFSKLNKSTTGFNLDELIGTDQYKGDDDFYSIVLLNILENYKDFDEFIIPKSTKEKTLNMLNNSDQVYMFFSELYEQDQLIFEYEPINFLYERYKIWSKQNGTQTLQSNQFSKRLIKVAERFGYSYDPLKKYSVNKLIKLNLANPNFINYQFYNDRLNILTNQRVRCLIKTDSLINQINLEETKEFIDVDNVEKIIDRLTENQIIIIQYLAFLGNPFAMIINDFVNNN